MRSVSARWSVIVVAVMLAACAPLAPPDNLNATQQPLTTSPQSPVRTTTTEEATAVEQAISDLAGRVNAAPSTIHIVAQEPVVWPNAGLGCPQPGIDYPGVQAEGMRIILSHAGINYEYHSGAARVVLCENSGVRARLTAVPLSPIEPTEDINMTTTLKIEPGMQSLIDAATADLAKRLSITRDVVEVVSAQSVVWPDRSLGCPQPGMIYPQVLAEGYRIELRVKGQVYSYHGGQGRGPFLCENPS